jgi:hypothetical protein
MPGLGPEDFQRPAPSADVQSEVELSLAGSEPFRRDQLQRRHFVIAVGRAKMLDLPRPPP